MRIGVHSGAFHADDVLSVAILKELHPHAEIIRTRDPEMWDTCTVLADVGGAYSPADGRFDHHQKGFALVRDNGVPYASSGLIWLEHGAQYVQAVCSGLSAAQVAQVALDIEQSMIQPADAIDVGVTVPGPMPFNLSGIVDSFNTTWQEDHTCEDDRFLEAVEMTRLILKRLAVSCGATRAAEDRVRKSELRADGKVLVLRQARLPYVSVVCAEMPDVLFVAYPGALDEQFQVRMVPVTPDEFSARADLPEAWAGLRDDELAEVTGVDDAMFCHNGRFICGAYTMEGAIRLAELAADAATH